MRSYTNLAFNITNMFETFHRNPANPNQLTMSSNPAPSMERRIKSKEVSGCFFLENKLTDVE